MPSSLVIRIFMPDLIKRNELAWVERPRYRILSEQAMQSRSLVLLARKVSERNRSGVGL